MEYFQNLWEPAIFPSTDKRMCFLRHMRQGFHTSVHSYFNSVAFGSCNNNFYVFYHRTKKFSFDFHLKVAKEVVDQVLKGSPKPEDLYLNRSQQNASEDKQPDEVTKKGLSDSRLWAEVMRNLTKDTHKSSSFLLTGSALKAFSQGTDSSSSDKTDGSDVIAFSCGHAYTEVQFESKVLFEFKERVQNLPVPIPETLSQLQNCYKKLNHYPLACPHCVFQYLRQLQLQECPEVPIKPWNQ